MRDRDDFEPTMKMSHAELTALVEVTRERSRRPTAEMPKLALRGLLLQDLAAAGIVVVEPAYCDVTMPVARPEPALAPNVRLAMAFVAAVGIGVLLTVPFW